MDISKIKITPIYASFLPILIDVMRKSDGPVLEMGVGLFSTPVMHWLCLESRRELVSYENDPEYFHLVSKFQSPSHKIILLDDWDQAEIDSIHWGAVLIDHGPAERRVVDIKRLTNNAEFIVVHDTEESLNHLHHYDQVFPSFKYRYDYKRRRPYTTVLSNFRDFRE